MSKIGAGCTSTTYAGKLSSKFSVFNPQILPKTLIFFDPLIGQFSFTTRESFRLWWKTCWEHRRDESDKQGNAWSDIRENGEVWADYYRNPPG